MSEQPISRPGMILRTGLHKPLEDLANEMLRVSLSGVTAHSAKSDILTPWKEQDRRRREVYTTAGTPDASLRRGDFHRGINTSAPHLNSVEGCKPPKMDRGHGPSPWDAE